MKSYKTKNMNLQLFAGDTITDLTGTSWLLNPYPTPFHTADFITYNIDFISNNNTYNKIYYDDDGNIIYGLRYINSLTSSYNDVFTYSSSNEWLNGSWSNDLYRTISITGGTGATNSSLISWLQANATQIQTGYNSTINLTNCTCNKSSESGLSGSYSATITANEGYYLSSVTSTLGTATIAENKKTATVTISDVTEDFTITAIGTAKTIQNAVLHPNNNGVTDYTIDLLPKAQPDATKQNLLTPSSVTDGTIQNVIGFDSLGNVVKQTFSGSINDYSETETIVGTWIDGKPIYRKVIVKNNTAVGNTSGSTHNIAHNISNMDTVINYSGIMKSTNSSDPNYGWNQIPTLNAEITRVNNTTIEFTPKSDYYFAQPYRTWYFILEYTKTTD